MALLSGTGGGLMSLGGHLVAVPDPAPPTLSLIDFASTYSKARPVVQRAGRGASGNVPVLFGWTGSRPSSVHARVMQGASVVTDWTALTGVTFGTVTGVGTLSGVPLGDRYTLQVRDGVTQPASGPLFSAGVQQWGVGVVMLWEGQSNMVQTLGGSYGDVVPGSSLDELDYWEANTPGGFFDAAGWHGPGLNDGSRGPGGQSSASLYGNPCAIMRMTAAALATKYGKAVPVGMVAWAWNSQSIETFQPGGTHYGDLFGASGTSGTAFGLSSPRTVAPGDFECVLWHQGEANSGDSTAAYRAKLQALYQGWLTWVAQFGRVPADLGFFPAVLGNYDPGSCPSIENLRAAQETFCAQARAGVLSGQAAPWPSVHVGWSCVDVYRGTNPGVNPPTDGLHFGSAVMQKRSARRALQSVLAWLGCAPFDGAGPVLAGTYSRSGQAVALDVAVPSGTALATTSGAGVTGFYANTAPDFSGAYIAVTAALVGGKPVVTFPGATTFPAYLKYQGGRIGDTAADANGFTASCYPDIRSPVYDGASYPSTASGTDIEPFGLPLRPTVGALTIN